MTLRRFAAAAMLLLATACSSVSSQLEFDPQLAARRDAGYRIAVMPFRVSAPMEGFLTESLAPVGELIALEGVQEAPMYDRLGALFRSHVAAWLRQSDYELLDPWHTDTRLGHSGVPLPHRQDPARAAALCRTLGVDAVLFGDVSRWNRSYYVVQSVAEVGLRLELVDATGRRMFAADRRESSGSGLTGGPTGYVSAATEPIAGLSTTRLRELTRSVARHAVADLNGGTLGAAPGPTAPKLALVALARPHPGPFRAGERIDVVAIGTPDAAVTFDIGRLRAGVPMQQTSVAKDPRGDRATYQGHYVVQPGDMGADLPITARIVRQGARRNSATAYRLTEMVALQGSDAAPAAR